MPPEKVPTNDLDLALMALGKSKSALPRFLRELGKGELWFLIPYHPEVIGAEMRIENGMRSPFVELVDATGPLVPVFSSFERAEEAMQARRTPMRRPRCRRCWCWNCWRRWRSAGCSTRVARPA